MSFHIAKVFYLVQKALGPKSCISFLNVNAVHPKHIGLDERDSPSDVFLNTSYMYCPKFRWV